MMATMSYRTVSVKLPHSQGFNGQRRSRLSSLNLRCNAAETVAASTDASTAAASQNLIQLTIRKPLGLVLSEKKPSGEVFVEEITPGGNAEKTGKVQVGDIVAKTSAIVLKSGKDGSMSTGHGDRLYDNWETVEFDCAGQDFNTVLAAIGSNNERWGIKNVTLTLRRDS